MKILLIPYKKPVKNIITEVKITFIIITLKDFIVKVFTYSVQTSSIFKHDIFIGSLLFDRKLDWFFGPFDITIDQNDEYY